MTKDVSIHSFMLIGNSRKLHQRFPGTLCMLIVLQTP
jgi:hypothetical protein